MYKKYIKFNDEQIIIKYIQEIAIKNGYSLSLEHCKTILQFSIIIYSECWLNVGDDEDMLDIIENYKFIKVNK